MTDEKWNEFIMTGKISDYLEYKKTEEEFTAGNGENHGSCNPEGNSTEGISRW